MLWNSNFGSLAGILCTGYFLHTCSLSILRSSKNPEKNIRDLFWGYFLVMLSYLASGALGYIGFIGVKFESYFETQATTPNTIDQNCVNMFNPTDITAFILRLAILLLIFSNYPLVNYFQTNMLKDLLWGGQQLSDKGRLL